MKSNMCKCCKCSCENDILINLLKKQEENANIKRVREAYVANNIGTIVNLVNKYNKLLQERPETCKKSEELTNLQHNLAMQIVAYTII